MIIVTGREYLSYRCKFVSKFWMQCNLYNASEITCEVVRGEIKSEMPPDDGIMSLLVDC